MENKSVNKLNDEPDDKIRIRTEEELHLQNEGLLLIRKVLEEFGCSWFLSGGTLLGAIRDGDFIKWDWDVEVSLLTEEILDREGRLLTLLQKNGFEIIKVDRSYENYKVVAEQFGAVYELLARRNLKGTRARIYTVVPAKYFESMGEVELRGVSYPCPNPPEEYLEYLYGDWKTPKRTADKEEYFSRQAFNANTEIRDQSSFIVHVMRRFKRLIT